MFLILTLLSIIGTVLLTGFIIYHVKTSPVRKTFSKEDNLMTKKQKSSNINRISPFKTNTEFAQEITEKIPPKINFNPLNFPDSEKTEIVLLIKNPFWLYTYWNIYEETVENFELINGKNSWNSSQPFLRVYNHSTNYMYDIQINDFANSWYIKVDNPNNHYSIKFGRKFSCGKFIEIITSNTVLTPPNDVSYIDRNWMPIDECWKLFKKHENIHNISSIEIINKD